MRSQEKIDKFMDHALDVMFKAVGFDGFDEEFTKQPDWYIKREWSKEQQDEFRDWLIAECRTKLRMRKKQAEVEAGFFLLSWGWKTKTLECATAD
jgi:hypothetical protein